MKYTRALGLALTLSLAPITHAQDDPNVAEFSGPGDGSSGGGLSGGPAGSQGGGGVGAFQVQGSSGVYGIAAEYPRMGAVLGDDVNAIINEGTPNSLEEALERAIKRNPEIALAAANRRQAEMAENLTKNKVFGSVVETYKQWQFDKQSLTRTEALHKTASVSEAELLTAKQAVMKSETALQFLLGGYSVWSDAGTGARSVSSFSAEYTSQAVGGPSGGAGQMGGAGMMMPGGGMMSTTTESTSGGSGAGSSPPVGGMGAAPAPVSKFDEKLSQPSGPVDYQGLPVAEFAQLISAQAKVPVIVDHHTFEASGGEMNFQINMALASDTLTWKEVLAAIADTHDIGFIIRDYGILVTTQQKAAAQGVGSGFFGGLGGGMGGAGGGGGGFGGGGF
jgi:hypothetical protein